MTGQKNLPDALTTESMVRTTSGSGMTSSHGPRLSLFVKATRVKTPRTARRRRSQAELGHAGHASAPYPRREQQQDREQHAGADVN